MKKPTWWPYDRPYAIKDSLYVMKSMPNDCVDLIVTSPNYNIGVDYGDIVDDNLPYEKYVENMIFMFKEMHRILKPDGRMCLNAYLSCGTAKQRVTPLMDFHAICEEIGFHHHSLIIWDDRTVCKKSAFGSFKSASAPYLNSPCEGILVMYKDQWKKIETGESDINGSDFANWTIGRWTMAPDKRKEGHPATFPVELPRRCIQLLTYVGDVVFDPFLGSGTTILAAKMTGRVGLGVEIEPSYESIIIDKLRSYKEPKNTEEYF